MYFVTWSIDHDLGIQDGVDNHHFVDPLPKTKVYVHLRNKFILWCFYSTLWSLSHVPLLLVFPTYLLLLEVIVLLFIGVRSFVLGDIGILTISDWFAGVFKVGYSPPPPGRGGIKSKGLHLKTGKKIKRGKRKKKHFEDFYISDSSKR